MTPSATGTFASTPLAHALVYARNRRLTGHLELTTDAGEEARITLWRGSITIIQTLPLAMCPSAFFGAVAYELGFIDSKTLDTTLLDVSKTKRLHGEILIERKALTVAQRDEVLVEQIHRKIHHFFSLPASTKYAFFDARVSAADPPVAVDCVGPVWRGIRDYPPLKFVTETTRRVGDNALRATTGGSARLPPIESALLQSLAARPMTVAEMKASTELPPARVDLLVYLLVIAKCVEAVSGARTHPSTGSLPTAMPSGPLPAVTGEIRRISDQVIAPRPPSSGSVPAVRPPSSGSRTAAQPTSNRLPGSSPRIPAVPGSSPRIPAQMGTGPRPITPTLITLKSPAELGLDGITTRAETIETESYFEVLGVSDGAPGEAVRAAFVRLAKTWHPDRLVADFNPVRGEVAKIFSHMTRAQHTLCDPDARRAYVAARNTTKETRPRGDVLREVMRLLERREFETVMGLCQGLVDSDSDDAEALAIHAWASTRAGEGSEEELRAALSKMDRAVNLDRTNDQAIYYRGLAHKRLGNVPLSFRDFARAIQLNPSNTNAEREVRILAMRVKKGSGEHKLIAPILEKLDVKK
jgi:curved DNA-binding protein CbpA